MDLKTGELEGEKAEMGDSTPNSLARATPLSGLTGWKEVFVNALRDTPVVAYACKMARISRWSAYDQREKDAVFRDAWDHALEDGWDGIEEEAVKMAKAGSERIIEFLLKGNKAKTYRETHGPLVNVNLGTQDDALTAALSSGALAGFFDKIGRKLTEKADSPQ